MRREGTILCGITGKIVHPTKAAAKLANTSAKRAGKSKKVYRCPICMGWHLTAHPRGK